MKLKECQVLILKNTQKRKHHPKLIIFLIILLAAGIFYGWGSYYYQRDRQIDRIVAGLKNPKVDMSSYVVAANPDMNVTSSSLKPLQNYFKNNTNAAQTLAINLRHGRDSEQIKLVQNGLHWLLFPRYALRIQVYRPQVETNHSNSTLEVNGQNLGKMEGADQNFYQALGLVFPGRYHLAVDTTVSGRKLRADSVVNIWTNKTVNMTIKTGTFQVRSVPNGIVYINDRKAKKLDANGQAVFKNYPLAKDMELYIRSTYNGKKIRSYTVKDLSSSIRSEFSRSDDNTSDYSGAIDYNGNAAKDVYQDIEGDYIVNPIWPGLIKQDEAEQILKDNFTKADEDDFVNDKDNPAYKILKKQNKIFHKGKKKLKIQVHVIKILPAGDDYSEVEYQVVYKYRYKGKKKRKVVNYEQGMFHNVKNAQLIDKIGTEVIK